MLLLLLLKVKGQGMLVVGQVVQAVLVATPILLQVVKDFFVVVGISLFCCML